jgi:predicted ArsR family transcriptional regulator
MLKSSLVVDRTSDIASLSALADPVRAAVFAYVSRSGGEVSRDEAATAVGVTRRVAAFHLDRLADEGWLDVSFRRLSDRTGPGAGRSSKLYRRSGRAVQISVPARNYELLARMLAAALARRRAPSDLEALHSTAVEFGRQLGESAKTRVGRRRSGKAPREALKVELADQGFEPFVDGGAIRLRNCLFHEMARENKDLVCNMNLAFMQGLTKGLDVSTIIPGRYDREGLCCVAFQPA